MIEALKPLDLKGRRVAVQLYGNDPNLMLHDASCGSAAQS